MNTSFLNELIFPLQDGRAHVIGKRVESQWAEGNLLENNGLGSQAVSNHGIGRQRVASRPVEWCIDVVDGHLLFATHSLQYLTAFESVLPSLGYETALPTYWQLISLETYRPKVDAGLESLSWTTTVLGALVQRNALSAKQAKKVLDRLSEDAIASLIGLASAVITWHDLPAESWHLAYGGLAFSPLVDALIARLQLWQNLGDRIISPHQRPYCDQPAHLSKALPGGTLPQQTLESLARLMQGASIRQLSITLKIDELKLSQLLYPYIQHRLLKLWPPVPPLDRLPWLPDNNQPLPAIAQRAETLHSRTHQPNDYSQNDHRQNSYNRESASAHRSAVAAMPRTLEAVQPAVVQPAVVQPAVVQPAVVQPDVITPEVIQPDVITPETKPAGEAKSDYLIICIDDNQLLLDRISDYLDSNRFKLQLVLDTIGSIAKICSMRPDLILLDITMPRIDGHKLCQMLRRGSMFKQTPIIMISSNTNAINKAKARAAGATDYLEKPFSKAQLLKMIEVYLPPLD
ncbi:MAG: PleD family two-component system response regulator [Phormidesmis sp.]